MRFRKRTEDGERRLRRRRRRGCWVCVNARSGATRYEDEGLDGLVDKRLSEVSSRRAPVDEVVLYRER